MTNDLVQKPKERGVVAFGDSGVRLQSLEEAFRFAHAVKESGLAPAAYRSAEAVLVVMQTGMELGYSPMQAIRNMWPGPDGRPNEYVEAAWARVLASGLVEDWSETVTDTKAEFTLLRKGSKTPIVTTYTIQQAQRAGLVKSGSNWEKHPERMLKARAKGFALKDVFADILRGMTLAENNDEFYQGKRRETITQGPDPLLSLTHIGIDNQERKEEEHRLDGGGDDESHAIPAAIDFSGGAEKKDGDAFIPITHPETGQVRWFKSVDDWAQVLSDMLKTSEDTLALWQANSKTVEYLEKKSTSEGVVANLKEIAHRAIKQ